jgi:hypothetical protein
LSYRREAQDRDYLNDFYKTHCTKHHHTPSIEPNSNFNSLEDPYVKMEADYLKAWQIYDKEVTKITPRLIAMIEENHQDVIG